MFRFYGLHVLAVLATLTLKVQCSMAGAPMHLPCLNGPPDDRVLGELKRMGAVEKENEASGSQGRVLLEPIEIDLWFHIVSSEASAELVTEEMVNGQLEALQKAYKGALISYRLQGVTRSINDSWAKNGNDLDMKQELRRGNYSTLNIYYQTDLQSSPVGQARWLPSHKDHKRGSESSMGSSLVLGFCTMPDPSINATSSRADYVKDGCNILAKTMPGGPLTGYSKGGTTIHETGHWHGLLHTFQGASCAPENEGDYIADTPQEGMPTEGCPAKKNSCPDLPGVDPIHNFMDYSSDDCYATFTQGQMKRVRNMWSTMRDGK